MRLSYEQAVGDYNDKKTDSLLSAYRKYHKINLQYQSTDPATELLMFYEEDNSYQGSM